MFMGSQQNVRALCNMVIVELPHWAAGADLVLISGACVTACTQRAPRPGDRVGSCISSLLLLFSTEMLMIQHEPGAWLNVTRLPRFWPSHCEQTFLTYMPRKPGVCSHMLSLGYAESQLPLQVLFKDTPTIRSELLLHIELFFTD